MDGITFDVLLTAAGAGVAATIITLFVDLVRASIPVTASWHGAAMAFVASAVLYVFAAVHVQAWTDLDAGLGVFVAWLTCATAAVGIHKTIINTVTGRLGGA